MKKVIIKESHEGILAIDKNGNVCTCNCNDKEKENNSCVHVLHQWGTFEDFVKEALDFGFITEEKFNEQIKLINEDKNIINHSNDCQFSVKENKTNICKLNNKECILGLNPNYMNCFNFDCSPINNISGDEV